MEQRKIYKICGNWIKIRDEFVNKYFLSVEAGRQMTVYISHDNDINKEIHLKIKDRKCSVKCVDLSNLKKTPFEFNIKHKGIKSLLKLLKQFGYQKGTVGEVATLSYYLGQQLVFDVLLNSFLGNIMFVYNNIDERKFLKLFTKLVDEKQLEIMDRDKITKTTKKLSLKTTEIIDNYGILDSHLNKFCLSTGFCSSEDTVSLKEEVDTFDNDYSEYEKLYYEEFGTELLGKTSINKTYLYKPVSIVIPCFNSEATIIQTIASIQSQNVPKNLLRKTEVILVDDGSNIPIENVLKKYGGKIYTQVKIVRLNRNSGPSTARNIGADVAKQKIILFIDSDILLPSNYLMEISIRNIFIPTAVFVTFKQNIEKDNEKISLKNIQKGLAVPNPSLDMRITKKIDQNVPGVYAINREKYIEILSETDCFKQFGYGRKVGIFDLPAMVVSHNVSTRRKNFFRAGGFSNEFIGWGMEDSFFGARMIARRNFIIPILSTGVYHIDHLPRSGSEEEKEKEFKINLAKYKKLMMDTLDED